MKQAKPALSDPTLWNVKLATSSSLHLPQLNTIQLHYHLHSASVVFSTHAADTSKSNCAHVCGETTSQPPAGLGAGCYLAGQLGFGGVVWASGRSEKGWSISGAELLLENRDISDLILPEIHSVTGGEKGLWRQRKPQKPEVQFEATRGQYSQTFTACPSFTQVAQKQAVKAKCQCHGQLQQPI